MIVLMSYFQILHYLEGINPIILCAHPVLLVHHEAPVLLLGEEPLEEACWVLKIIIKLYHIDLETQ